MQKKKKEKRLDFSHDREKTMEEFLGKQEHENNSTWEKILRVCRIIYAVLVGMLYLGMFVWGLVI